MATTGIRQRHSKRCNGDGCSCPWEASVYSKRDGKKMRQTFPTKAAAVAWRETSAPAVRRGACARRLRRRSARQPSAGWRARGRADPPRSGDPYKPAASALRGA